ncbi:MAG: SCP-like extracellular [Proteobacteria bacterium]|nr:SCP-like extracellular [Pseudomonadota bacterium]
MQQQQTLADRNKAAYPLVAVSLLVLCLISATPSSAADSTIDAMCMLQEHNTLRAAVGTPVLRWSDALARQASTWADELKKTGCVMQHSRANLGENIYWASAWKTTTRNKSKNTLQTILTLQPITEAHVISSWAVEQPWYSQASNTCNAPPGKSCGHYTQIVWQNTKEVGCARAVCDDKSQVWVCNYSPAGNVVGQRPY